MSTTQDYVSAPTELLYKWLTSLQGLPNISPLLPAMFSHRGKPLTLADHFHFEPMFNTQLFKNMTWKTGRQTGKSLSTAIACIAQSGTMPFFNQLFITPLYETTRRFSSTYIHPLINDSPVRDMLVDKDCAKSVLMRSFKNQSIIFFSYALLDATRTRGYNTDHNRYDEAQDIDPGVADLVQQTASGSKYDIATYTGTPKTTDTLLEARWLKSSKAEWHIWCDSCGYENIPSLQYDLIKMIGPQFIKRRVTEEEPGIVCARCSKCIYPRTGRWVHHVPENRVIAPGYHVPQIILPLHYSDPAKWRTILTRREASPHAFYNEVCGEAYDIGAKLISKTELIAASEAGGWPCEVQTAIDRKERYIARIIAVDWGGGGETEVSRTVIAAMGMRPDASIDVLCAFRFPVANDYPGEVSNIFHLMRKFNATHVVHDFGGAGAIREHLMVSSGLPLNQIVPVSYVGNLAASLMRYVEENPNSGNRGYYQLHKSRAFVQTCQLIRNLKIRFFKYDYKDSERPGLINDFLSLVEHRMDGLSGGDKYIIRRAAVGDLPDDFANAVNIGTCALYQLYGKWPDLAGMSNLVVDKEVINQVNYDAEDGLFW